jgi:hypothetical protein
MEKEIKVKFWVVLDWTTKTGSYKILQKPKKDDHKLIQVPVYINVKIPKTPEVDPVETTILVNQAQIDAELVDRL